MSPAEHRGSEHASHSVAFTEALSNPIVPTEMALTELSSIIHSDSSEAKWIIAKNFCHLEDNSGNSKLCFFFT